MRKLFTALYGLLLMLALAGVPGVSTNTGNVLAQANPPPAAQPAPTPPKPFDPNQIQLQAPLPGQGSSINIKGQGAVGIMGTYVSAVYKFMLALIVIFAILMLMIAGYEYMFAGGDSGKTENAKTRAGQVLLGLVLAFMAAVLLNFINPNFFRL